MNFFEIQIKNIKERIKNNEKLLELGWEGAEDILEDNKESLKYWENKLIKFKLEKF